MLAEEADDERVDVVLLGPVTPRLERVRQLVDLAPVRQRHADGLRECTLFRQVARRDDGLDVQLRAVDAVELEQLQKGVLQLGLGLVQLVDDEDELLALGAGVVRSGKEFRRGVVHALLGRDDGKADEVGSLQNREVQVNGREARTDARLLSHFGLAGTGHSECEQVLARDDVEVQDVRVRRAIDFVDSSQHFRCPPVSAWRTCHLHRPIRSGASNFRPARLFPLNYVSPSTDPFPTKKILH